MDMAPDNMSISPVWSPSPFALQLDYFHPGRMNCQTHGAVHHKTIPDTILAQVLEGRYEVVCDGQEELLQAGEVFVVPARHPVTITHHDSRAGRFRARWIHMRFSWMGVFDYLQSYSLPLAVRGPPHSNRGYPHLGTSLSGVATAGVAAAGRSSMAALASGFAVDERPPGKRP
jgi:hypothetical protein